MLKLGIPLGGVRQALQKEGKDPNIIDMDPEKSHLSQVKGKESVAKIDAEPLLKDDPELGKFFKVSLGNEYKSSMMHLYQPFLFIRISIDAQNGYATGRSAECS